MLEMHKIVSFYKINSQPFLLVYAKKFKRFF